MTDRFYPVGKPSYENSWKSTYEVQNEMRSFQRSAYPPGYSGHEPGAREKFGFSTPGPNASTLTQSGLALQEAVDVVQPRRIQAMPRHPVTDDRETFTTHDVPEMHRSYNSAVVSPNHRSMAKTRSLPTITPEAAPPRLGTLQPAKHKLECDHFSYFVPKALNREDQDRLMSRSLPKLYKHPEKKVVLPFNGDGTGFRTQSGNADWWPAAARSHEEPSVYSSHFARPTFYRMSPVSMVSPY